MESPLEEYLRTHSTPADEALEWIRAQTCIHTNYPQMLSGPVQGRLLTMLAELSGARRILEIGTFTGYSTVCLARGLGEGGHVDALEINDEMEDMIRASWGRAAVSELITLHIGDALEWLRERRDMPASSGLYDMVYIDANKREYLEYYEAVLPLLRPRGLIVADDVMQGGKVYEKPVPHDAQTLSLMAFNDAVASDPRVEVVLLPLRDGLSLILKK